MPAGARVLTVEYKINLMAPAVGDRIAAIGEVIRTITVCRGTAYAHTGAAVKAIAEMQATVMTVCGYSV